MKRKLLPSFALALLAATSAWAYDFKSGDLYYNIIDEAAKTVEVTYEEQNENNYKALSAVVNIPRTVEYNNTEYKITSIGNLAFMYCSALTQVSIPNGVTSIEAYAFQYCPTLTQVTIPESVTNIGNSAFKGCDALTQVTWNAISCTDCKRPFEGCPVTNFTFGGQVEYIPAYLCYGMGKLTEVTIPNSVTSIGEGTFENCSALTQVTIPNSVTSIGDYAFRYCSALMQVTIPNGVKSIGNETFLGCDALTQVTIPESVTSIGDYAFYQCSALTAINVESNNTAYSSENGILFNKDKTTLVCYPAGKPETTYTIPESVTSIGEWAFYQCSALTQVTLPNSVTSIGDYAFESCSALMQVNIPESVTSIGEGAFSGCSALTQVNIPNSVTSIGDYAFCYCSALTQITIPESVTNIGEGAFYQCSALTQVNMPNSVTSIGVVAFYYCSELTQITIPESVTNIGEGAFYLCSKLTQVTIGCGVESIGESAFEYCKKLTQVTWNAINCKDFSSYYSGDKCGPFYDSHSNITAFTFGDQVEHIPAYLCNYMNKLTEVTLPESVTSIGEEAFYRCEELTQITIPNSVTSIGDKVFSSCRSLTQVTIPESVTSIGSKAFSYCYALMQMTVQGTVPPTVGTDAFYNVSRDIPVYVPAEALEDYQNAEVWKEFDLQAILPEPATDGAGVYQISNAEELYWFVGLVNGTLKDGTGQNRAAKAVLTADILLNDTTGWQEWNQDTELPNIWTPIGYKTYNNDNSFTGSLDGQGHTISGIYVYYNDNTTYENGGLFGCIGTGGTVKNLGITASYIYSYTAGGIAGNNRGTISYCYNSGIVYGYHMNNEYRRSYDGGGIAGINDSGTIIYCYNAGNITGGGGIAGYNENGGAILHCHSVGTSGYGITGYNESNCTVTNCYYMAGNASNGIGNVSTDQNGQTESRTAWQFSTGEVCWLLNGEYAEGAWRQTLDKDPYPVLKGPKVVKVGNDYQNDYSALERTDATAFRAWQSNGEVFVEHTQDMTGVALYDVTGRLLHQMETNGYGVLRMAAPGKIHIVRATYADGTTASQKVM